MHSKERDVCATDVFASFEEIGYLSDGWHAEGDVALDLVTTGNGSFQSNLLVRTVNVPTEGNISTLLHFVVAVKGDNSAA